MCGHQLKTRNLEPRGMIFLARPSSKYRPFVHMYITPGSGEDFFYSGSRAFESGDRKHIVGTVP